MSEFLDSTLTTDSPPLKEPKLTSLEVKRWFRSKQVDFLDALEAFAKKDKSGFQRILDDEEWEKAQKQGLFYPKIGGGGEFTGAGLCTIACGVIEEVLRNKYGNRMEVALFRFITTDMDTQKDKDISERYKHYHHIIRFRVGKEDWQTIDPTYKQFRFKIKPRKILITPTKNERELYTYEQLHQRALKEDPENAWQYLPHRRKAGEIRTWLEKIKEGKLIGITERDYMNLLKAFSD